MVPRKDIDLSTFRWDKNHTFRFVPFSSYKYRIPLFGRESFENKSTQESSPIVTRGLKNKIHVGFSGLEEREGEGVMYLGASKV